ncbi:MAG: hypothetical protein ACXVRK_16570 [Gaiellaceae bacterium]
MKPRLRYLAIAGGVVVVVFVLFDQAAYLTSTAVFADGGIMQGSVGL